MKIFDAHLHIIDPNFPIVENQGYKPKPFTVDDYVDRTQTLNIVGGAIVSGSFQAFDQSYLIDVLDKLGTHFVGVTQLPCTTSDEEIFHLDGKGVKAVRFNVKRGGSESLAQLEYFAKRVYELVGWHVELYIDSKSLSEIAQTVIDLPAVSIDHLGLTRDGFHTLLSLVEKGVRVKATGFGRIELDVREALQTISSVNPDALLFGTDLPSTRAPRPFAHSDVNLVVDTLGEALARKVLYDNAIKWYRLDCER
ncbi:putative TIM-barrel fold metal-dependent hydrolase [Croceifilum oryzae]|uniref:TIM-barrel fold metal-dependent hydrolase n=1 Tax=Croceifilum oryzae TaxID=1553429 RepID=A0AAJ1WPK0_9BACL|nr:amidohydrolase family protein [Croceifilum oryzae]MDQ0416607.1 putative TIM-barrel fold metal-dependent hydrolase [Croceifilum oryzae]